MLRLFLSIVFIFACISINPAFASVEFKQNNPDIGKFEFCRSYISALNYINHIKSRWLKVKPRKDFKGSDLEIMRAYVTLLVKDNADLRIAKNYLKPYITSPNLLIRKVSDIFIITSEQLIAINDNERKIWDEWYAVKSEGYGTKTNEKAFIKTQREIEAKRALVEKKYIESTALLAKVMLSDKNSSEKGKLLAINQKERASLLRNLDGWAKETLDWGMRPGQDYIQASVGILREVLEDTAFTSNK